MKLTRALSLIFALVVAPLVNAATATSPDTAAIKHKLTET